MPLVGADDTLPARPRRVLVAGPPGAGKTTVAALIASVLRVPRVEIDGLYHGPGWVPRPTFEADVHRFTAGPAWVTEWQYDPVRQHLAELADLMVWLDLPRGTVMRQIVRRTLARRIGRRKLWNGNVEPPLHTFFTDPEHIVRWAWNTHGRTGPRMADLLDQRPGLTVVRLRNRAETAEWLAGPLARAAAA
ncbi:AAA family ATPase [Micromonosporaceae bacterium Da 78-11]